MINAKEAKNNVANCHLFILEEIEKQIIYASKRGETSISYAYDEKLPKTPINKVIKALEDNGYTVKQPNSGCYLSIYWK